VRGNSADQLGRVSSEWDSMRVLKEGNRNKRDKKESAVAMQHKEGDSVVQIASAEILSR
jgi:hypothetical protein